MNADPRFIAGTVAAAQAASTLTYTPMDRVSRLQVEAAEQRARADRLAQELDNAYGRIARLLADLSTLKGENVIPAKGCRIMVLSLAGVDVQVEYEYTAADEPTDEDPGWPEEIVPLRMFVNGRWVSLDEFGAALDDDRLQDAIKGIDTVQVRHPLPGFEPFPQLSVRGGK